MLDVYGLMEDMTGYSSLAAIPLSIIAVRALLYPAYVKMRIKMPEYHSAVTQVVHFSSLLLLVLTDIHGK